MPDAHRQLAPRSVRRPVPVRALSVPKDFCLWAPPTLSAIGDSEGEVVAWCTQTGHGARLIPAGTITGAQFIRTPSYIEVTGIIKQTNINVPDGDGGGELDSGGQDDRGNPIGGVAYSTDLPASQGTLTQSRVWHECVRSEVGSVGV